VITLLRNEHWLWGFENRVLKRIFGPKRAEETREWRRILNEELYDVYSSPHITRVIKSRRLRWTEIVARMGTREHRGYGGEI
jgi:hypothetical protein